MSNEYQAIYDAVRSRFGFFDAERAIKEACNLDASMAIASVAREFESAAYEMQRPSAVYRPRLAVDGDQWGAVYGENLMEGVAGFGDSPAAAMADFDKNWNAKLGAPR